MSDPTSRPISPDGTQEWDGTRWVPRQQPPGGLPPPPMAPKKRSNRGCLIAGIVAAALVVLTIIGFAASSGDSKKATSNQAATTTKGGGGVAANPGRDGSCAPQPCANDSYGWIVTVSGVTYDAPGGEFDKPESGNVFVTMQVTFTNKLGQEQNANPSNFVLQDGAGIKHTWNPMSEGPCQSWEPVNVTKGAAFGPKCLSFEATAGKPTGLILVWTPTLLGGDYNMKLS